MAATTLRCRLLLCLAAMLLAPRNASGQAVHLDVRDCSFPPKGGNSSSVAFPTTGCPRQVVTNATLAAAKANAWKFAPQLHMHPLEPHHLQVRQGSCIQQYMLLSVYEVSASAVGETSACSTHGSWCCKLDWRQQRRQLACCAQGGACWQHAQHAR